MISIAKIWKWTAPRWLYWAFFILTGFFIIVYEDSYQDQEIYGASIIIYFLLLFLAMARWIFGQLKVIIGLRKEKAKTELIHLQSQVNPHFFFNILNSLYGWVEKDPKQTKKMILKLSDMMRYSIYDGQKEVVPLEEEIAYLKNYIQLHQMRYSKKIDISFDVDIPEKAIKIKPLLFIILLENAFKHGVENLRSGAFININISNVKNDLSFSIENNYDRNDDSNTTGIGLDNLKRRLELVYPKKHNLSLSQKENIYKAHLTLNLK